MGQVVVIFTNRAFATIKPSVEWGKTISPDTGRIFAGQTSHLAWNAGDSGYPPAGAEAWAYNPGTPPHRSKDNFIVPTDSRSMTVHYSASGTEPDLRWSLDWIKYSQPLAPNLNIGLFRPSTCEWFLPDSAGHLQPSFVWGDYDDPPNIPITGDWDHVGVTQVGLVRVDSNGSFVFSLRHSDGSQSNYTFGNAYPIPGGGFRSTPIAGDWDGDGRTEIGVVMPDGDGLQFVLAGHDPNGPPFAEFIFGNEGCIPITGNWNGGLGTGVGVAHPDGNGSLVFDLQNADGKHPDPIVFGDWGWLPITGDWDADKQTELGAVDRDTASFYLRGDGPKPIAPFSIGGMEKDDIPITGNWGF